MTKIGGQIDEETLLNALRGVIDPQSGRDVVGAGIVSPSGVRFRDGRVSVVVEIPAEMHVEQGESLCRAVEQALAALPGVQQAFAVLTSARAQGGGKAAMASVPENVGAGHAVGTAAAGTSQHEGRLAPAPKILAVASGKGGVGKSTVAANLAVAMARAGKKVGFLDADIYGPSGPILFGLGGYRPAPQPDKRLIPAEKFGVRVMSIGFMAAEGEPVVWRGPMVQSGIVQMLRDTDWGDPDILIIDTPPGTGDAQMALAQKSALTGVVIVTTPQAVALADARKGLEAFRRMNVPVLGVIENMGAFVCPCCGTRSALFGEGGGRREATRAGVPFLGEIPITPELCALSDSGTPIVAASPDSAPAQVFTEIAKALLS